MDFAFTEDQLAIKDSVGKLCAQFDGKYWLKKDKEGGFPEDFYRTMADAGWLGIAMPEEYGGSGLGITEAALLMQTVAGSGGVSAQRNEVTERLEVARPATLLVGGRPGAIAEIGGRPEWARRLEVHARFPRSRYRHPWSTSEAESAAPRGRSTTGPVLPIATL